MAAARKGKGRQAVRNKSGGFPSWGFVVVGLVIGLGLMYMVLHRGLPSSMRNGPQANPQATAETPGETGAVAPGNAESAPKKPQFDFYSVLSEKEVRIPDAEISAQAKAEQKQQAAANTPANTVPTPAPAAPPAAPVNAPVATQNVVAAPPTAVPQPSAGSGYLLQVGAFPNPADAETMKAKLAMQGFVANVQSVSINGQTFHRVRLGPFPSASALEATKQRLSSAGISSIALKEGR